MYKKLYEEEQKLHSPYSHIVEATSGSRCTIFYSSFSMSCLMIFSYTDV